jgi:Flp pilus assembly pilin Flp
MPGRTTPHRVRLESEAGQTMTEYAVSLAAVAIVTVATFTVLGTQIGNAITTIGDRL